MIKKTLIVVGTIALALVDGYIFVVLGIMLATMAGWVY